MNVSTKAHAFSDPICPRLTLETQQTHQHTRRPVFLLFWFFTPPARKKQREDGGEAAGSVAPSLRHTAVDKLGDKLVPSREIWRLKVTDVQCLVQSDCDNIYLCDKLVSLFSSFASPNSAALCDVTKGTHVTGLCQGLRVECKLLAPLRPPN